MEFSLTLNFRCFWAEMLCLLLASACFADPQTNSQKQDAQAIVDARIAEALDFIQERPWPDPLKSIDVADSMALLLLYQQDDIEEANRLILDYCGQDPLTVYAGKRVPKNRCESLYRAYLLEQTRELLSGEARTAIEDHAWALINEHHRGITWVSGDRRFWEMNSSENHFLNDHRRFSLALEIVRMSPKYGPKANVQGKTIDAYCERWLNFWKRYFRDRADEGVDIEIAHPSSYASCTVGVYYDLYDFGADEELRELAGNYLTLFWAEVASEFEPRTGQRAGWASTRNPFYDGHRAYWARDLLRSYHWHDNAIESRVLGDVLFLTSSYRPPEILSAIARDPDRGSYLTTSRRPGLVENGTDHPMIFDDGDSHIRRDVYYTPDYALSTITYDPRRHYRTSVSLAQCMGVTFANDQNARISVIGTGFYSRRAINGITGDAVSIIARDLNAEYGRGRFKSDGTRVFISNGDLWENRVEDPSGWFFTHTGASFVAIRAGSGGYESTKRTFAWPNRRLEEVVAPNGQFLELNDMWAPLVIQMGQSTDYANFEAFCASVKENQFVYQDRKLTYRSEAGDKYQVWSKGIQMPEVNGAQVNLNPEHTYATPYLKMIHGASEARISYPGYDDVVLRFTEIGAK